MFGFKKRKQTSVSTPALSVSLQKTQKGFAGGWIKQLLGKQQLDETLLEELENELLAADVGVTVTEELLNQLKEQWHSKLSQNKTAVIQLLQKILVDILKPCEVELQVGQHKPFMILMVGVNGAGKTTSIAKLAQHFKQQGLSVMLAAGDTFRAAATEQLQHWGDQAGIPVIAQGAGADSASVIFDAMQSASAKNIDVLIADTAGRLHTQSGLMDELSKINRVIAKHDPTAPHEILQVLDGNSGQNAISQLQAFQQATRISGILLSKLDGTAKGGILFAIAKQFGLPIRYLGVGEAATDLRPFNAQDYVEALITE